MQKRRLGLVVTTVVLAMLAVACGNSGDDSSSSSKTTTSAKEASSSGGGATDVGVTKDEVRVSQIVSTTGVNVSGQAGFEKGFEAYVEALNERGGVAGRKIKIVSTRNDNSEPARQASEFQQAVEQDKVFLVAGSWPSFGGAEYAIQHGIPVVGTNYDTGWHRSDDFFGVTGGSWKADDPDNLPKAPGGLAARSDYYLAKKLGSGTKFGTFGYTQAASKNAAESVCSDAKTLGLDCVYTDTSLNFGFTDIGASIDKIKSSGAKLFYAGMDLGGCTTILRSFKRAGLNDIHLHCAVGYGSDATEKFADVVENMFVVVATAPFESDIPEMKRFIKELAARKPGTDPSTTVLNGWMAGIFIEDVLKEVGPNLTRAKFIETARHADKFKAWSANNLENPIDWTTNRWKQYQDPNFKPDPTSCSGYLLRVDTKAKKWAQVGMKPSLCFGDATSGPALDKVIAKDKTSLDVSCPGRHPAGTRPRGGDRMARSGHGRAPPPPG
jgi:ABC-type branched-subunit amino acid transport system substrate-binding protein